MLSQGSKPGLLSYLSFCAVRCRAVAALAHLLCSARVQGPGFPSNLTFCGDPLIGRVGGRSGGLPSGVASSPSRAALPRSRSSSAQLGFRVQGFPAT